ncbi:hypothetical protein HYU20_00055 [Candidatus Woesearchaeota archaeon]|nr:hypothetical protein [Candidatus Woesearchaeota archaeon]
MVFDGVRAAAAAALGGIAVKDKKGQLIKIVMLISAVLIIIVVIAVVKITGILK